MRFTWFLQFSAFNLRKISAQIDIQMFHRLQAGTDVTCRRVNTPRGGETPPSCDASISFQFTTALSSPTLLKSDLSVVCEIHGVPLMPDTLSQLYYSLSLFFCSYNVNAIIS